MTHKIHDIGVAARIGTYSDCIEASPNQRWLFTSGTPGMDAAGELPGDITAQAELAWGHILTMLDRAGMAVGDLVKITQYLTRAEDIPAYAKVRARMLGDARPASMMLVVAALPRPEFLLEIEAVAARA
ncbi:MAG: RidA family protein [Proteobacteria bacterium]|nr:RidA family protein [Pseudomonadota bacterium]